MYAIVKVDVSEPNGVTNNNNNSHSITIWWMSAIKVTALLKIHI